jgi:mannose-6-phosphate isomerase-like protein (cupin superfamily)
MDKKVITKPWGSFEQFVLNKPCTVKILTINKGEEISLQKHSDRDEFWRVIEGKGSVVIGSSKKTASVGKEFFIKKGQTHQIIGLPGLVKVLEISFGKFDEKDIIRIKDKYNRK